MAKHLQLCRPQGIFSAVLHGDQGPLVVCLHGFPDNLHTFDPLLAGLLADGFRVLTPVMRGYESATVQPDGDYNIVSLAGDVIAWLDYLEVDRAFLLGHDWGGVTGWTAIALAPERFHAYVSLAIPHLGAFLPALREVPSQIFYSWYMSFFQLPGIADWAIKQKDWALIRLLWKRWSPGWTPGEGVLDSVIDTLKHPGVATAALGYYRCLYRLWSPQNKQATALAAAPIKVPALALAGESDGCIAPEMFSLCMAPVSLPGFVEAKQLPGLGHFLHQESPEKILAFILGFFHRWRIPEHPVKSMTSH